MRARKALTTEDTKEHEGKPALHGAKAVTHERFIVHSGNDSLLDALFQRLFGVDRYFRIGDGLKAGFHFEIKRERSVVRGVRRVGFEVERRRADSSNRSTR